MKQTLLIILVLGFGFSVKAQKVDSSALNRIISVPFTYAQWASILNYLQGTYQLANQKIPDPELANNVLNNEPKIYMAISTIVNNEAMAKQFDTSTVKPVVKPTFKPKKP